MKIGIDLGGTKIATALVDKGVIIKRDVRPTPKESVLESIIGAVDSLICSEVDGIGIGVPSVVDSKTGTVYDVCNIPSWKEVPLGKILSEKYRIPISINNDANVFALGEKLYGQGKEYSELVGLTLGTGVGAGVIVGGRLYSGANTSAGEIGSLPYRDSDYEHYCSGSFFLAKMGRSAEDAAALAKDGDAAAKAAWREFGAHVGKLISAVMLCYDPQAIIIGGSISKALALFRDSALEILRDYPYSHSLSALKIIQSTCHDSALLGAAALTDFNYNFGA